MKFDRPPGEMYEISECGRYTVCFAYVAGIPTYQGWRRSLLDLRPATLLTRNRIVTKATARAHCVADAERIAAESVTKESEAA